ncbi:MAG: ion transporter [Flavobacteriaceae bacterium]|nr:MAG: ion transporter [Flavobacteriaceae bacterium]
MGWLVPTFVRANCNSSQQFIPTHIAMNNIKDPGFGYSNIPNAQRLINKNGSSNIFHKNKKFTPQDTYSFLIHITWLQFLALVFTSYIVLNTFFAFLYLATGINELTPSTGNTFDDFLNAFFFSAQTITTVGYGGISPHGMWSNLISSIEALIGLLGFAFITGILYGRFSKPNASINFSDNIIIRPFNNGKALMFRLMNNRTTIMIEPEVSVMMSISDTGKDTQYKRKFYQLDLERNHIKYLPTIWTIVHEIAEDSPLFNLSDKEVKDRDIEWYVMIKYFDESFAQQVYQMHSYTNNDLICNVKFIQSTTFDSNGFTVLDHNSLSKTATIL